MKNAGLAMMAILSNDTDVNAAVSGRIFNERVLQGTSTPYICFHSSMVPIQSDTIGLQTAIANCQINVYSDDNDTAQTIAEYVRLAMEVDPLQTFGGVLVQSVLMEMQFSDTDDTAGEEGLFCEVLTFQMYLGV